MVTLMWSLLSSLGRRVMRLLEVMTSAERYAAFRWAGAVVVAWAALLFLAWVQSTS